MTDTLDLAAIREQIDHLDSSIQTLITQRAELALRVGESKRAAGETTNFYRPEREAQVIEGVKARNHGPLSNEALAHLFLELMAACRAIQEPLKVAFLGPLGTFSHEATVAHFGSYVECVPLSTIDQVFREVEAGAAPLGLVPVENSTEGSVNYTLDMFVRSPLRISGEVEMRIHHNLLSLADNPGGIRTLYSHPQSLAQCREWINANLPQVAQVPVGSNAEAAKMAAENPQTGAIASEIAADIYGLNRLAERIEDEPNNSTRFAILSEKVVPPTGNDKTALVLSIDNRPGALYDILRPFADCGVSMTRVESRPSRRGNWDYVFFIDVLGHEQDEAVRDALDKVRGKASLFKILGSFPRTV